MVSVLIHHGVQVNKNKMRSSGFFTLKKKKTFSNKKKKGNSSINPKPSSGRILEAKFKMRENLLHSQAMDIKVSNKGCKSRDV